MASNMHLPESGSDEDEFFDTVEQVTPIVVKHPIADFDNLLASGQDATEKHGLLTQYQVSYSLILFHV